jgi:hypothetical protein
VWFQTTPQAEPEPEVVLEPAEKPAPDLRPTPPVPSVPVRESAASAAEQAGGARARAPRPPKGGAVADAIAWAALIFLAATIGWAAVQYRQTVAELWPGVAPLYQVLGLPVEPEGIALTDLAYQHEVEDGQPVLAVTGKVVNVSNRELPVPVIRVMLSNEAKQEIYHWMFDSGVQSLKPGAESPFITRLSSPPREARNLNIRFAEAGETQ